MERRLPGPDDTMDLAASIAEILRLLPMPLQIAVGDDVLQIVAKIKAMRNFTEPPTKPRPN